MARSLKSIVRGLDITTKNAWMNYLIVNPSYKGHISSVLPNDCPPSTRLICNNFIKEYLTNDFRWEGRTDEKLTDFFQDLFLNCKTYKKDVHYHTKTITTHAELIGDKVLFEMMFDKRILSPDRYLEAVGKLALSRRSANPLNEVMFMNWATNSTYRFKFDREFWKRATEYKRFLS